MLGDNAGSCRSSSPGKAMGILTRRPRAACWSQDLHMPAMQHVVPTTTAATNQKQGSCATAVWPAT
jgi:hypothetical protein